MRLSFHVHARIPVPERLVLAGGRGRVDLAVRFGVLERPGRAPVLIDAGWPDRAPRESAALRIYRALLRPRIDEGRAPLAVLDGRAPAAVILSHLHADHVGAVRGLSGVPVHGPARALAHARHHPWRALRHGLMAELLPDAVEDLEGNQPLPFGLGRGRDVLGDGSVLSLPLPGHAEGHSGLLFPAFDPPVLYAADVQWVWPAIAEDRPPRGPARAIYADARAAMESLARVRAFAAAGGRVVLCHDPAPVPDFTA
ncbi:MBL fold metallo-hydrolase [Histidinibacterium lentulum]|uniref:MBL fold metallo-hydrolase n=1 Tax=Histidinibacterium lentulum TaxID=2480588 RepID=A0A3N2R8V8_9RHOB|nr:MBL fold metallo-hydrolase [Histidinibacterium lentulum]ROU03912.1 MBL fold metallo-hydrolase [Histidinibacterium lentulum]